MNYVLKNCQVIDGNLDSKLLEKQMIYVKDGHIEEICEENTTVKEGYKVVDLKGAYVMPGLINMHVHLFGTGKPSKALSGGGSQKAAMRLVNSKLGNVVLYKLVKKHAYMQLQSGVTTIRSVGDFRYSDVKVRDKINAGKLVGPRLIVSGPAITTSIGHGAGTFAITSDDVEGLKALVRQNAENKVDFIKTCTTGGVMDAKKRGEPGEVKMTLEQTKAVCDEAHRLGMKVASHVESSEGLHIALLGGVDTIEHGSSITEEDIKLFKERNAAFISTLSPALPLASLDYHQTKLTEFAQFNSKVVLDNMISCGTTVIKEGITMGMGTDASCPFVSQYSSWRELLYTTRLLGASNSFAIYTATLGNAKILGLDKEIGTVENGKWADLLIVKENPLDNLQALSTPMMVITKGKIVKNCKVKHNKQIDDIVNQLL